jgi:hypothetical protein
MGWLVHYLKGLCSPLMRGEDNIIVESYGSPLNPVFWV